MAGRGTGRTVSGTHVIPTLTLWPSLFTLRPLAVVLAKAPLVGKGKVTMSDRIFSELLIL